jgi:8-oxo-dGTP pyrophosphatase MutT (NUDIX family)
MIRRWRNLESEILGDYSVFRLRRDRNESQMSGASRDFYVLEAPAWINISPLTGEGKVVLIRQYRHGLRDFTLEIPGGMVDPEDPSVAAAARRELREETGYDSDDIVEIGVCTPNPALQANRIHSFLARDARRVGEQDLQGSEEIDLDLVDLVEIPALVRDGRIHHALVVAAFYHLDHYQGG